MQSSKQKNNNPKFWHDVQIYDIEDVESIDQDHSPTINIKFINSKPKNHNNLAHPSKPKDIEDTQTATVSGTPLADSKVHLYSHDSQLMFAIEDQKQIRYRQKPYKVKNKITS